MKHSHKAMKEVVVNDSATCDLCGLPVGHDRPPFFEDDVTIEHRCGPSYPEDGNDIRLELDICGPCFLAKVRPALEALGIKCQYRNAYGPCEPGDREGLR
jgi:hypothetical protein